MCDAVICKTRSLASEIGIYSIEHRFMVKDPVHLVFLKR
jgi:hypothetical protein